MGFWRKRQALPAMTLEGVLGPNSRLEEAAGIAVASPHALGVDAGDRLVFSSGASVLSLESWGAPATPLATFAAPITALGCSPGGALAVGLEGGALNVRDASGDAQSGWRAPEMASIVDALFLSEDELVLVDNGYRADEPFLSLAPWDGEGRGKVVRLKRRGGHDVLATGLFCPMGVAQDARGELLVTEFERARILDMSGAVRASGYPGYLGHLRRRPGGYVLTAWARRDPLIEFLKTERRFVEEMKATIAPRHWIAPRISPEFSHDFPIELGATRLFGEVKPWAPSFSYGLLMTLDEALTPTGSAQSRAHGRRHAIADALVWRGDLIALSKASGELLNLGPGIA